MFGIAAIRERYDSWRERRQYRRSVAALEAAALRNASKQFAESINQLDNYVDPRDAWNDDGKQWIPLGNQGGIVDAEYPPPFTNQGEHSRIRSFCRFVAAENEYAAGELETRVSYIVGTGHVYKVEPLDEDDELTDGDKALVMEVVDEFIKTNKWHARQQEIQRRLDRDGECFLRFFVADADLDEDDPDPVAERPNKVIKVRFVEPGQVYQPEDKAGDPTSTYGVVTDPDDVETVRGYYVDKQFIAARDIQHRKRNVDCNVKRGLPLLYQSKQSLPQLPKITRNAAVVTAIQAAFALIRKHASASQSAVSDFVTGKRDAYVNQRTLAGTTKTRNYTQYPAGTILDVPSTTEYEFPASGIDPSKPAGVVQMVLRGVGSRACMPEFMISGDASNANYASTLVAEGPAVKMFQREQWTLIEEDREVFDRVLRLAVKQGRLSRDLVRRVKICAEPPNVISRDELQGAQKNQILYTNGIKSPQTWALEENLDYEREQQNIEEHAERNEGAMLRPMTPGDIPQDEEGDGPGEAGDG